MSSNPRLTALLAALAIAALAVFAAGCGDSDDDGTTAGGGEGGGEPLTIGTDTPYPPFEQGAPPYTGFDIDLMNAVAENIGRTTKYQDTSFDTIFRDLAQGRFEAVASATTITDEREKTVDFTNPYYLSEQAILVKEGSDIKSVEDLDGANVATQQGTTGQEYVEAETDAGEERAFPEGPDTVNAVKNGTVDAAVLDYPVAQDAVEKTTGIEISAAIPTEEQYGFVVAQENDELLEELNEGLAEAMDDGTYAEIYKKWFKKEPPKSIFDATHDPS
jgi:ABC-type amino acid transport substrate-binding protein